MHFYLCLYLKYFCFGHGWVSWPILMTLFEKAADSAQLINVRNGKKHHSHLGNQYMFQLTWQDSLEEQL